MTLPAPARRALVIEVDAAPTAAARRALPEPLGGEHLDDTLVFADVGARRRVRMNRRAIAPVAVVTALLVATTAAFATPLSGVAIDDPFITAKPAVARETAGISRLATRTPIATTPAAATSTPIPSATATKASASPTASRTTRRATPAKKVLAAVTGSRYATVALNVRADASTSAAKVASLGVGDKVSIVGASVNGWQRVRLDGSDAWVKASFLSKTKPAVEVAATTASTSSAGSSVSGQACASGSGVESGLTATGVRVHRAVCNAFPSITSYGGYRAGSGEHSQGRALDIMVSGPLGWEIANFLRAHASALGVTEVIYQQRIWTRQRSSDGWRSMSDRGSATANHYDHVHVTF